jgi:predicted Zn-dependent protease
MKRLAGKGCGVLAMLLWCPILLAAASAVSDEQLEPPKIDSAGAALPQLTPQAAIIPDIPWQPPAPRLNAKTPFAPKFLAGNNIFAGEKEYWLADAIAATEIQWPRKFSDPSICYYLTQLTHNLGRYSHEPDKHYEIVVVDTASANGFTAGGGRIYITRGMLRQVNNEDELAGVIAHEIGHDNFHHAGRTATRQMFWSAGIQEVKSYADTKAALKKLLEAYDPEKNPFPAMGEAMSGIGRADEQSADKAAFYFVYKAGYNPLALAEFFERAGDPTAEYMKSEAGAAWPVFWTLSLLFDSHPPAGMRVAALRWESNFVGETPKDVHANPGAFQGMKARLKYLDEEDARKAREARDKRRQAAASPKP